MAFEAGERAKRNDWKGVLFEFNKAYFDSATKSVVFDPASLRGGYQEFARAFKCI